MSKNVAQWIWTTFACSLTYEQILITIANNHPIHSKIEELIKFHLYCGVPINLQSIINELCSLQIALIQVHSQSIQSAHHS